MAGRCGRWLAMLAAGLLGAAWMQAPARAQSSDSAQARRDELAKVLELVKDPDPLQRAANMEEIVASGDALKTQLAIKAAIASNDQTLRGLAMAAYMASVKNISFEIRMPDPLQKQYDQVANDPVQEKNFLNSHNFASGLKGMNFQLNLAVKNYSMNSSSGVLWFMPVTSDILFTVSGPQVQILRSLNGVGDCSIQFHPEPNVTLAGTMRCAYAPLLKITAQLY